MGGNPHHQAIASRFLLVSISVNFPISVNQSTKQNFGKQMPRGGIDHDAMRIINTTPKYLSIPKFCSKKRFIRGVVTFDPFGQKKTVYGTLCNFSRIGKLHNEHISFRDECFGILRGQALFVAKSAKRH